MTEMFAKNYLQEKIMSTSHHQQVLTLGHALVFEAEERNNGWIPMFSIPNFHWLNNEIKMEVLRCSGHRSFTTNFTFSEFH